MKVLVLSRNVDNYKGAFYQSDFLTALLGTHDCRFYGPGFPKFDTADDLEAVIEKSGISPDLILVAHAWLADSEHDGISPLPNLALSESVTPTVLMLNKEYTRLDEKLAWAEQNAIALVFSHHHDIETLISGRNLNCEFMPFAFSPQRFWSDQSSRSYDFGFSGILKNPGNSRGQGDVRFQVMSEIFRSIWKIPVIKRKSYRKIRIFWRSWSGKGLLDRVVRLVLKRPSEKAYSAQLRDTKIWLNGPSPLGLISTRFFECMASGTAVLTARTPGLNLIFPSDTFAEFDEVAEFESQLKWLLKHDTERKEMVERARLFVLQGHTWDHRIADFSSKVAQLTAGESRS